MHGGPAFESLAGSVFHFGGVAERLKAPVPKTGGRKSRRFESCPLRTESWLNGKSAGPENRFPVTPDRRVGTCTLRQEGCLNGQRNALLRRRPKGHAGSSPAPSANGCVAQRQRQWSQKPSSESSNPSASTISRPGSLTDRQLRPKEFHAGSNPVRGTIFTGRGPQVGRRLWEPDHADSSSAAPTTHT